MIELTLSTSQKKKKTHVKKHSLEPIWHEQFIYSVSPESKGPQPTLMLDVKDWDEVSAADPMGSVKIDLADYVATKGAAVRRWYELDGGEGAIEVIVQWRYSPSDDWRPFGSRSGAETRWTVRCGGVARRRRGFAAALATTSSLPVERPFYNRR